VPLAARNVGGSGVLACRCVVAKAAGQLVAEADIQLHVGTEFIGGRLNAGDNGRLCGGKTRCDEKRGDSKKVRSRLHSPSRSMGDDGVWLIGRAKPWKGCSDRGSGHN